MVKKIKKNKVTNIDCIEGLRSLKSNSVDIIICDPPYNIGKCFGNNSDKQKFEDYLQWCSLWISECIRVLKEKGGTLYIYGFSEILSYIRTLEVMNEITVRWLIWHYTNKVSTPRLNFWQRTHESILCCYKKSIPVFNRDDVREPYTANFLKHNVGKKRQPNKGSRFDQKGTMSSSYKAHSQGALPRDVIKVPTLAGGMGRKEGVGHPTQKPIELCKKLITASCNKDRHTTIVIPFAGSGSECVAATELNNRRTNGITFYAFEINDKYVNMSNRRLKSISFD